MGIEGIGLDFFYRVGLVNFYEIRLLGKRFRVGSMFMIFNFFFKLLKKNFWYLEILLR